MDSVDSCIQAGHLHKRIEAHTRAYLRRSLFSLGLSLKAQDFEVSVEDALVNVKSSSRVGDSDLGVNAKRALSNAERRHWLLDSRNKRKCSMCQFTNALKAPKDACKRVANVVSSWMHHGAA